MSALPTTSNPPPDPWRKTYTVTFAAGVVPFAWTTRPAIAPTGPKTSVVETISPARITSTVVRAMAPSVWLTATISRAADRHIGQGEFALGVGRGQREATANLRAAHRFLVRGQHPALHRTNTTRQQQVRCRRRVRRKHH